MNLQFHNPTYEARALDASRISLRAMLPMVAPDASKQWVHLAYEGSWSGHHQGPFKFDKKVFEQIIANFETQANPIPCTYEHPEKGLGVPILAGGWIHQLEMRQCDKHGLELWGYVEFTDDTAAYVKQGKLKFCSVVVDFKAKDRKTSKPIGAYLAELGFTNTPFLDGQHELKLSYQQSQNTNYKTQGSTFAMSAKDLIEKAYTELGDNATPERVAKFVDIEKQKQELVAPQPDATPLAEDGTEPQGEAESTPEPVAEVAEVAKKAGVEPKQVLAAMAKMPDEFAALVKKASEGSENEPDKQEGEPSGEPAPEASSAGLAASMGDSTADVKELSQAHVAALKSQVSERDGQLQKLSQEIAQLKDSAMRRKVEDAIKAGHILDKDRDKMVKLGQKNPELLEEFLSESADSPAVPTGTSYQPSQHKETGAIGLSEEDIKNHMTFLAPYCPKDTDLRTFAIEKLKEKQSN